MIKIREYLNTPYFVDTNNRQILAESFAIGLFIFLFLLVFKPFGINTTPGSYIVYVCAGFGLVTFIVLVIDLLVIPIQLLKVFDESKWKIRHQFLMYIWVIFTIGIGNTFYAYFLEINASFWQLFISFQIYTFCIGLIPATVTFIIAQNQQLKKNLSTEKELNNKLEKISKQDILNRTANENISIKDENNNEVLNIRTGDLLYMKSMDNYAQVYWKEHYAQKDCLVRSSLSRIEKHLDHFPDIFRCHRSFIVNAANIKRVSGNSQGLRLIIGDPETIIPVSRRYTKRLRKQILNFS